MKTIKLAFAAALVIGSVACKNESAVVEPTCNDAVKEAQGKVDLAVQELSILNNGRTSLTAQRNDILDNTTADPETLQFELDDVDSSIEETDSHISAQSQTILEAKEDLIEAILACPTSDQSQVVTLQTEVFGPSEESTDKEAREMISELSPKIVETYETIEKLEAEKLDLEDAIDASSQELGGDDQILNQDILDRIEALEAVKAEVEADLLDARKLYTQYSDARRWAYYSLDNKEPSKN